MSRSEPVTVLEAAALRRLAISAQGLAEAFEGPLDELVRETGFVRSVGGVDAYIALKARSRSMDRSDLDRAVLEGSLRILPSARACIYLVPGSLAAFSLGLSELLSKRRNEREAEKAGIRQGELLRFRRAGATWRQ